MTLHEHGDMQNWDAAALAEHLIEAHDAVPTLPPPSTSFGEQLLKHWTEIHNRQPHGSLPSVASVRPIRAILVDMSESDGTITLRALHGGRCTCEECWWINTHVHPNKALRHTGVVAT